MYDQGIKLYEDERCCFDERTAINKLTTKIVHLWRMKNAIGAVHLATYINLVLGIGVSQHRGKGEVKILTSWERSINALALAYRVGRRDARPQQL